MLTVNEYSLYRKDRLGRGGGVAVYVWDKLIVYYNKNLVTVGLCQIQQYLLWYREEKKELNTRIIYKWVFKCTLVK